MSLSFADLGVDAGAANDLLGRGIIAPFPIQAETIPAALAGRDICGKAPTGSGKTIAFGIPVAARVGRARPGKPRALILAPTRELASQIHAEMSQLIGSERRRRVGIFYGGVGFGAQLAALRRGVDVAVACPGRLKDLIGRRAVSLSDVSIVVLDEADRMADMGFLPEVTSILDQVATDRQTFLFSATLDSDVDELIDRYQRDPLRVTVEDEAAQTLIEHRFVNAKREERLRLTAGLVGAHGRTIVFCRTQHGTDRVARQLVDAGVDAVAIHGGRSQAQREEALNRFSTGSARALVATDVAARGIHVDSVACVVHFDLPTTAKDYLHRSGRTGRAGLSGVVIAFVAPTDKVLAQALQGAISHPGEFSPTSYRPREGRRPARRQDQTDRASGQGARGTPVVSAGRNVGTQDLEEGCTSGLPNSESRTNRRRLSAHEFPQRRPRPARSRRHGAGVQGRESARSRPSRGGSSRRRTRTA